MLVLTFITGTTYCNVQLYCVYQVWFSTCAVLPLPYEQLHNNSSTLSPVRRRRIHTSTVHGVLTLACSHISPRHNHRLLRNALRVPQVLLLYASIYTTTLVSKTRLGCYHSRKNSISVIFRHACSFFLPIDIQHIQCLHAEYLFHRVGAYTRSSSETEPQRDRDYEYSCFVPGDTLHCTAKHSSKGG